MNHKVSWHGMTLKWVANAKLRPSFLQLFCGTKLVLVANNFIIVIKNYIK